MRPICFAGMLLCCFTASTFAAQSPARDLFDALRTTPQQWDVDAGVSVQVTGEGVKLSLKDKPYASAAPQRRLEFDPSIVVTLKLASHSGDLSAQVEWLDESGKLLQAVTAFDAAGADKGLDNRKLSDFLPTSRGMVARFRLKLWIGGKDANVVIREFRITGERHWQTPAVRDGHAYDATGEVFADKGMLVDKSGTSLLAKLEPNTPYSAFVLADRISLRDVAAVMLDLEDISPKASISVQMLCWDSAGNNLKSADLMKDVLEAGVYEVPLSLYRDQVPPQTDKVSFKIWLGGGEGVKARLAGLYVASPAEAK